MSIIWWTLYVLGAMTILIAWVQIMAMIGSYTKAHRDKVEGKNSGLTRTDIEALVRMEIQSYLSKEDK